MDLPRKERVSLEGRRDQEQLPQAGCHALELVRAHALVDPAEQQHDERVERAGARVETPPGVGSVGRMGIPSRV